MVQTLTFFFLYLQQITQGLNLDEQIGKEFELLVSVEYVKMALKRCTDKNQRAVIRETLSSLMLRQRDGPWKNLAPPTQAIWDKKARQCAAMFQRTTSHVSFVPLQGPYGHFGSRKAPIF
jgi:hypothetical protein